jgi:hypothetical protein
LTVENKDALFAQYVFRDAWPLKTK